MTNTTLTNQQDIAVKGIKEWFLKGNVQDCSLVGYAGTGKTFLVNYIIKELGFTVKEVAFAAYTGKASLVLKRRMTEFDCKTIHRLAYTLDPDSKVPAFILKKKKDLKGIKLIVIDEASMVTKSIYEDLLTFGIPILLIGDEGQLPAIGETFNVLANPNFRLTEIHRQAAGNPIIHLSMLAREGKAIKPGTYGNNVYVFEKGKMKPMQQEKLYIRADQIICGYNSTRNRINNKTRELLGFTSDLPQVGDKMICLKNSWDKVIDDMPLINGMTGFVEKVNFDVEKKGPIIRDAFTMDFRPDFSEKDYFKDLLLPQEDFTTEKLELEHFEFPIFERFDWGHCITAHKSQGSQYENLYIKNEILNRQSHHQWLYTAITRASENLILEL